MPGNGLWPGGGSDDHLPPPAAGDSFMSALFRGVDLVVSGQFPRSRWVIDKEDQVSRLIKLTGTNVEIHRFPVDSAIRDAVTAARAADPGRLSQSQWLHRAILAQLAAEGYQVKAH